MQSCCSFNSISTYFIRIFSISIRELSLSRRNSDNLDPFRSCYILMMTDLIDRYLIHKIFDEFRQFLIEEV
jgi:hypothetical protein